VLFQGNSPKEATRMDLHANAALSWTGRRQLAERVVGEGWTVTAAAEAAGVSVRCARKWIGRYRAGDQRLLDRSSAPQRVANRTAAERIEVIVRLRRLRMTAAEIAETLSMPLSTVSGILTRRGLGRLGRLGLEQPRRYERSRPGELVHFDVKKLGRIGGGAGKRAFGDKRRYATRTHTDRDGHRRSSKGWEYVHIAVDDYRRLAYAEVLKDDKASTATSFLQRAIAFYRRYGINVERVLTDNGSCYRATLHALACRQLGIRPCAHAPTGHKPTAKPNASSAPSSTTGPTQRSTAPAANAPAHLTAGSGTTTIDAHTQHSATNPRPPEPTCSGPTSSPPFRHTHPAG
jgi:transposase